MTIKLLEKICKQRGRIPIIKTVRVKHGTATATNLDTWLSMPFDTPDGLYKGDVISIKPIPADINMADYPEPPDYGETIGQVVIAADDLSFVAACQSKEEVRYYINGICLRADDAVATNGHILGMVTGAGHGITDTQHIIPREAIEFILAAKPKGNVTLALHEKGFRCELQGGLIVSSCYIDGTFPPIDRVIPTHESRTQWDSAALRKVASAWKRLSESKHCPARISGGLVTLVGHSEYVPFGGDIGGLEIGFSLPYLLAMPDKGTLEYGGACDPVKIVTGNRMGIVMPMRV